MHTKPQRIVQSISTLFIYTCYQYRIFKHININILCNKTENSYVDIESEDEKETKRLVLNFVDTGQTVIIDLTIVGQAGLTLFKMFLKFIPSPQKHRNIFCNEFKY